MQNNTLCLDSVLFCIRAVETARSYAKRAQAR